MKKYIFYILLLLCFLPGLSQAGRAVAIVRDGNQFWFDSLARAALKARGGDNIIVYQSHTNDLPIVLKRLNNVSITGFGNPVVACSFRREGEDLYGVQMQQCANLHLSGVTFYIEVDEGLVPEHRIYSYVFTDSSGQASDCTFVTRSSFSDLNGYLRYMINLTKGGEGAFSFRGSNSIILNSGENNSIYHATSHPPPGSHVSNVTMENCCFIDNGLEIDRAGLYSQPIPFQGMPRLIGCRSNQFYAMPVGLLSASQALQRLPVEYQGYLTNAGVECVYSDASGAYVFHYKTKSEDWSAICRIVPGMFVPHGDEFKITIDAAQEMAGAYGLEGEFAEFVCSNGLVKTNYCNMRYSYLRFVKDDDAYSLQVRSQPGKWCNTSGKIRVSKIVPGLPGDARASLVKVQFFDSPAK
ncbi:hypothetical protein ACFLQY_05865 [Verrucomicrobiota bacterium]